MGVDVTSLVLRVDSREVVQGTKDLDSLSKQAGRTETAAKSMQRELAKFFGGLSAVALIKETISAYSNFSSAISELSAITGAAGDDLKYYREQAKLMGQTTTQSASKVVEAMKLVGSAKPELLSNKEALAAVTKEVITLAEASGLDMPTATKAAVVSLNQFSEGADQASRFVNVLAAGAKYGASEIGDAAEALKNAGTVASSLDISFEETNAAIQAIGAAGIYAGEAGTGLRAVLLKLSTQTRDEFNPEIVGLAKAFQNLAAANLTTTEKSDLFGLESIKVANALLLQADSLEGLTKQLTGTNVAYEQARVRNDNLGGDVKRLMSSLEGLAITIGEKLDPFLRSLAQHLAGLTQFINDNIGAINHIVQILGILIALRVAAWFVGVVAAIAQSVAAFVGYEFAVMAAAGASTTATAAFTAMRVALLSIGGLAGLGLGVLVGAFELVTNATANAREAEAQYAAALKATNGAVDDVVTKSAALQQQRAAEAIRTKEAAIAEIELQMARQSAYRGIQALGRDDALKTQQGTIAMLRAQIDELFKTMTGDGPRKFKKAIEDAGTAAGSASQDSQDYLNSLKEQLGAIGLTEGELKMYNAELQIAKDRNRSLAPEIRKTVREIIAAEQAQDALNAELAIALEFDRLRTAQDANDTKLVDDMQKELELLQMTDRERAVEIELRKLSATATDEQRASVERMAKQMYDLQKSSTPTQQMQKLWDETFKRIDQGAVDLWKSFLDGGKNAFQSLKDLFKQTLAEMLNIAITRPIIVQLETSFGNSFAQLFNSGAQAASGGASGGSGMLSTLFSAGGMFSSTGTIGRFLTNSGRGFGSTFGDMGFSNLAGNFVAGYFGNQIGQMLSDKWGGGQSGSSVGGMVGGTIGSIWGPVGSAIGAALGNFVGSYFGAQPSDMSQWNTVDLSTGKATLGGMTGSKFSQSNKDASISYGQAATAFAHTLTNLFDSKFTDQLKIIIGNRDGLRTAWARDPQNITNYGTSTTAFMKGIFNTLVAEAGNVPAAITAAFQKIDFSNFEQALADVQFIGAYMNGDLFNPKQITESEQALNAINAQFDSLKANLDRLGLSTAQLASQQQTAINNLIGGFDQGIQDQIMQLLDPMQYALQQEEIDAQKRLDNATAIGANIVEVERLNAVKRQQIIAQYAGQSVVTLTQANTNIQTFLDKLKNSSSSYLLPGQRLDAAQAEFNRLLALSRSQDAQTAAQARADIVDASQNLIDANREVFGSTEMFFQSLDSLERVLGNLIKDNPALNPQAATLSTVDDTIAQGNAEIVYELKKANEKLAALEEKLARQQDTIDRMSAA